MTDDGSIQIQDLAPAFHPDARDASIQYEVAEILHELFCGWTENCAAMPIRHLRRNVPRHISKAIMKALREAPEDRHATSVEFLRRIRFGPWELRRQMLRSILHRVRLHRDDDPGQLRSDIA